LRQQRLSAPSDPEDEAKKAVADWGKAVYLSTKDKVKALDPTSAAIFKDAKCVMSFRFLNEMWGTGSSRGLNGLCTDAAEASCLGYADATKSKTKADVCAKICKDFWALALMSQDANKKYQALYQTTPGANRITLDDKAHPLNKFLKAINDGGLLMNDSVC
jgi:hypothetical protein